MAPPGAPRSTRCAARADLPDVPEDPLAASRRDLAGLEMGGAARSTFLLGLGQAADLTGTLRLRSGDLRGERSRRSSRARPRPSIAYSWERGSSLPNRPIRQGGPVAPEATSSGRQELGPLEMPAVLVPNHLYLGERSIRPCSEPNCPAANPGGRTAVLALPHQHGGTTGRSGPRRPPEGTPCWRDAWEASSIPFPSAGTHDRHGRTVRDLFGGRLDIRNVTAERPFSAGREIGADVNVRLIDLERLSQPWASVASRAPFRFYKGFAGRLRPAGRVSSHDGVGTRERGQPVREPQGGELHLPGEYGLRAKRYGLSLMTTFFKNSPTRRSVSNAA